MIVKLRTAITAVIFSIATTVSYAALSPLNNNVRIFEDTLWLAAFTLMIFSGFLLRRVSGGLTSKGYLLLALAGFSGAAWKGIGLSSRLLLLDEPTWFSSLTRDTVGGVTGLILAVAFVMIAYSVIQLVKRQKAMMQQRRRQN